MDTDVLKVLNELRKDGEFSRIKDIEKFSEKLFWAHYKRKDIPSEIRKASLWIFSNPKRKKKNYSRFLTNWMAK